MQADNILSAKDCEKSKECIRAVALELHDEIDRMLLAIILQLEAVQQLDDMETIMGRLAGLQYIAEQNLEKVQQVYTKINPYLLSRVGLKTALSTLIQEFSVFQDIEVKLKVIGELQGLPHETESIVFKATNEILSQLQQHLYKGKVTVQVTAKQQHLFLQITAQDQQLMQDISIEHVASLHKQVAQTSGKTWIQDQDGQSTSINVLVPLS